MPNRPLILAALLAVFLPSSAAWTDKVSLGKGGEPSIATDGKGNVYATAHLPCNLFMSRDWGKSFTETKNFPDAQCDMHVFAMPDGRQGGRDARSCACSGGTETRARVKIAPGSRKAYPCRYMVIFRARGL